MRITLIPGDGIGPEVTSAAVAVIEESGANIEWVPGVLGAAALEQYGTQLPEHTVESIRETRIALKGPVTTPVGGGFQSPNVLLRKALGLYANLRPVKSIPGLKTRFDNIDLVVVRENTEDLYSGIEHEVVLGVVESIKVITKEASSRIAQFAYDYAGSNGRKKITAVHKANILKLSDGLFIQCVREVALANPEIDYKEMIVDNACMQLVIDPNQFDVLLAENLYGDIISEICAGLVGGVGVVGSANIGAGAAVFETVHGSAPDIAGTNSANPTGMLMASVMMLRHIGEIQAANRIEKAVFSVYQEGKVRTRDVGGSATTKEFASTVIEKL